VSSWQLVVPIGEWQHPEYGRVSVTPEKVRRMAENFRAGVYAMPDGRLPATLDHDDGEGATGWIADVRTDQQGLWAFVEWTGLGQEKIASEEFPFISPEWSDEFTDSASGKTFYDVLKGISLVVRPFFKTLAKVMLRRFSEGSAFGAAAAPAANAAFAARAAAGPIVLVFSRVELETAAGAAAGQAPGVETPGCELPSLPAQTAGEEELESMEDPIITTTTEPTLAPATETPAVPSGEVRPAPLPVQTYSEPDKSGLEAAADQAFAERFAAQERQLSELRRERDVQSYREQFKAATFGEGNGRRLSPSTRDSAAELAADLAQVDPKLAKRFSDLMATAQTYLAGELGSGGDPPAGERPLTPEQKLVARQLGLADEDMR
jgi:hypothetical protein